MSVVTCEEPGCQRRVDTARNGGQALCYHHIAKGFSSRFQGNDAARVQASGGVIPNVNAGEDTYRISMSRAADESYDRINALKRQRQKVESHSPVGYFLRHFRSRRSHLERLEMDIAIETKKLTEYRRRAAWGPRR